MKPKLPFVALTCLIMLSACSGQATPAANANVPVVVDQLAVVANGRLLPAQSISLSFAAGGQVAQLLVTEGLIHPTS